MPSHILDKSNACVLSGRQPDLFGPTAMQTFGATCDGVQLYKVLSDASSLIRESEAVSAQSAAGQHASAEAQPQDTAEDMDTELLEELRSALSTVRAQHEATQKVVQSQSRKIEALNDLLGPFNVVSSGAKAKRFEDVKGRAQRQKWTLCAHLLGMWRKVAGPPLTPLP